MVKFSDILAAKKRLAFLPKTPLFFSAKFSELIGKEIWFKNESVLPTGAFKDRGAANFLAQLSLAELKKGVIAASAGNHAQALAFHARRHHTKCTIVMPENTPVNKIDATAKAGAKIILHGQFYGDAYKLARQIGEEKKLIYVPAYNHPWIIAGQGTVGLEIVSKDDFDAVICPIGGGGLFGGSALAIKEKSPKTLMIGVRSAWAEELKKHQGITNLLLTTIAEGIAVKSPGEYTSPLIKKFADQMVVVSEQEIALALYDLLKLEKLLVEGASAAAVAGLKKINWPKKVKKIAVILSGSNIDMNSVSHLIQRGLAEEGKLLQLKLIIPDRPGALERLSTVLAKEKANILDINHSRFFTESPGFVEVTVCLETRNEKHQNIIIKLLKEAGWLTH